MKGTLLNVGAVVLGASIGLAFARVLPLGLGQNLTTLMGYLTVVLGIKMALEGENFLLTLVSLVAGGIAGYILRLSEFMAWSAEVAHRNLGGSGSFSAGLVTATVLFCVGPMTIMGCLQDALERRTTILQLKSTLDGISSVFLAATLGVGVLVSAIPVLLIQGAITLAARPLRPIIENESRVKALTAAGGVLLLSVGLNISGIKKFPTEMFLPALILAPLWANAGSHGSKENASN